MKNLIFVFFSVAFFFFISCNNQKTTKPVFNSKNSSTTEILSKKAEVVESNTSPSSIDKSVSDFQFTGEPKGCESFTLYKLNADKTMAIRVNGDREFFKLSSTPQSFSFGKEQKLFAQIYQFNGSADNYFCNDVADENLKVINKWDATEGTIKIHITEDNISVSESDTTYKMTLIIESINLKDKNNELLELKNITFENVLVGWYSG